MSFLSILKKYYHIWRFHHRVKKQQFDQKTVEEIFTETYQKRYWRSRESVSGAGSELRQTETLRRELPILLKKYEVKTLLDLPCGDFNWLKITDLSGIQYLGADIVSDLVEANRQKFSTENISFQKLDLLTDPLPKMDCVLVRDCLVHLSFENIWRAIESLKRSGCRFLLTTSFPNLTENKDIQTGYWRPLNLEIAPFHFPKPLEVLVENCTEMHGEFDDKSLMLWELQKI